MLEFSTVDGFLNVKEGVDEMIKYIANEPSVGLYFVQQHAHSSMPYLLSIKDKVVDKVHEVTLHTEDIEDSIDVVRSMTDCGVPIADQMIKDISKSLHIMSASQPKRGLITPRTPTYSPVGSQDGGSSSRGYLSTVFNSAKQKAAAGLKWPISEQAFSSKIVQPSAIINGSTPSTPVDAEADVLPVSSSLVSEDHDLVANVDENLGDDDDVSFLLESYDKFRFEREVKLEEWLRDETDEEESKGST